LRSRPLDRIPRAIIFPLLFFSLGMQIFAYLGNTVSDAPPSGIDLAGRALVGQAPQVALVFTESCYIQYLLVFMAAAIVLAVRSQAWRGRAIFAIVTGLISWRVSDFFKDHFARPRPEYWILKHETSFSYSSGHAMFAVLVYWLWAYYFATSDLPRGVRIAAAVVLGLWGAGVIWSRLALGAHYVTDLTGGVLLALSMICIGWIVARLAFPNARVL
jgi:undecaprenyl-diphosphatase